MKVTPARQRAAGLQANGSMSAGCIAPIALTWSERILDALYDRIKSELAFGGVEQAEAIDQPATAAEHYLLVENVSAVITRNDKPTCPAAGVGDSEACVRGTPQEIHVTGGG
jgi:hypothetical protein